MKTTYCVLTFLCGWILLSPPSSAQDQPVLFDVYQLGQSYRTPMSMFKAFASSRGHQFRSREKLPPGVPIRAHWKNESARRFVAEGRYRVLCLVPYYDLRDDSPPAAAGFFGLALQKNPDVRAYLVDHWPARGMPAEQKEQWLEENLPLFEKMVDAANEAHPDARHPMRLIPRAAAFMQLLEYGDRIPGFSSPSCAYNDGGHAGNNANYMFAVMEYCWIYNELPWGLPLREEKTGKFFGKMEQQILFDLTEEQALALQRIGIHNLAAHPKSGYSLPEDHVPPPAPPNVTATATPRAVRLDWPEVTDEGVGVYRYVVTRNDGREFDHVLSFVEDTQVAAGASYTYSIVAEDVAGNRSAPSAPVSVRVPEDHEPPQLARVLANENPGTVRIEFNEDVAPGPATAVANYSVPGLEVRSVRLADDRTVVLNTSDMTEGETYTLKVGGIADTATPANKLAGAQATFTFEPPEWHPIDLTRWEGAQMHKEGSQIRITAKGDGDLFKIGHLEENPPIVGYWKSVDGDFDFPLAITSQGKVAANEALKPYQRKHGFVKTGILIANDIRDIKAGNHAALYLSDVPRFHFSVSRNWLVTARVIGAGLRWGDPREYRNGFNLPVWIRLVRRGKKLTAYFSLTGVGADEWQKLGTIVAEKMPDTVHLCVFTLSGVEDEASTAMLDLRASGHEQSYTNPNAKETP